MWMLHTTRYIIYSQDYYIYWTITDSLFSCTNYMIYTVSVVPDGPVREIDVAFSYECCTKVEDFRDAVVEIWVLWRRKNIVQLLNIAQLDNHRDPSRREATRPSFSVANQREPSRGETTGYNLSWWSVVLHESYIIIYSPGGKYRLRERRSQKSFNT